LNEILALEAVLFGSVGTAFALARGFPLVCKGRELPWLATGSAGLIISACAFAVLISGKVWFPWS
jgi:hypothetical protein